jgi:transglutaminase-like putative cysteine protease
VTLGAHQLLVRPREGHDLRIESSLLDIRPAYRIEWHREIYGNSLGVVTFTEPSDRLRIASDVIVQHYEDQPLDFALHPSAEWYPFSYDPLEQIDLVPYQTPVFPRDAKALKAWIGEFCRPGERIETNELLRRLNTAIVERLSYAMREEPGVQSPIETLTRGQGSCRDLATLFIEACRFCGLAARFVSGYLLSEAAVEDYGSTHAWSEIYLPGAGWRGYDSTSGKLTGPDHIAVAVNRRPDAVPPVSGSFLGPAEPRPTMEVQVRVRLV